MQPHPIPAVAAEDRQPCPRPLYAERISAGFPSPAQGFEERALDLHELCVVRPSATFFLRVEGDSMIDIGIFPGDIVVVDRSLEPQHRDVVIAAVAGEFTIKRLVLETLAELRAENPAYAPIAVADRDDVEIFGVVRNSVRTFSER